MTEQLTLRQKKYDIRLKLGSKQRDDDCYSGTSEGKIEFIFIIFINNCSKRSFFK